MMWVRRLICRFTDHDMRTHTIDSYHRCYFTRRVVRQITRTYMPVLAHFVIPNRRIC